MKKLLLLSALIISSIAGAQTVAISAPNGGEVLYSCQQYTVTWTQTGSPSNYWNIDYSLDGGTIWTSVTSNYLASNGTFLWTVPYVQSSTVLMRVRDALNNAVVDQSNAYFTINIPVLLTAPNGGEVWQGNTTHNITWTSISTTNYYTISYSINSGTTWVNIVTNYFNNTGTYAWTVPALVGSTTCLVRVMDYTQNCMQDVSNAVFTITPAQPLLLTPNGGETFYAQCGYYITWDVSTLYTYAVLEYSINNGSTWVSIVNGATNNGSYYWYFPITPTSTFLVRISNYQYPSLTDVSDAVSTIAAPITVNSANGGESLYGCSTYGITWTASNCISRFYIYYSTDNGSSWINIANQYNTTSNSMGASVQTYNWLVPNTITTANALFKVTDYYNNTTVLDQSNAVFNINPSADITVTAPNGGETWIGNSVHTITWNNLPAASGQYTLQYSTNGGSSYTTIVSNISGNSYSWTVPNTYSTTCIIKVIDFISTCKYDLNNAYFTITPAQPLLLTPNGGEVIYAGDGYYITWDVSTLYTYAVLEYSLNNGATWTSIVNGATNNGSYYWNLPALGSTQCLVRLSNYQYPSLTDVSDALFTIKPPVTVLTPNGNNGVTIWGGCTVTSITFDRAPAWTSYKIEYSVNNGASWILIINNWSASTNPATYNWNIGNIPTNQALVRVTAISASYADQSDAVFSITKPVTLIQPNFGGIMQVGNVFNITWSSDGISNLYDLYYSINGGSTFTNIVTGYNTSNNTYPWTVPNNPSNNCRIWVKDNINSCKGDTSDVAFIISTTPAAITLSSPNGIADTLNGCHTKTITWTEPSTIGTYNLAYSLNSGTTWTTIVSNYATTSHTYDWLVPNTINSNTVLLRVQSSAAPSTTFDLSDAYFTIRNGHLVASPHSTSVCYGVPVNITSTGGFNYNWTPASGLSATNISNPVATPATSTTYTVQSINGACILSDTVHIGVTTGGTTASVAISASPSNTICTGNSVTFTATPANGGSTPVYVWKVNTTTVGTNSPTYTSSTLNNNDVVTCIMTSNLPCVAGSPATSNAITMTVSANLTPSVTVSSSPSGTICAGTSVTFTANPTNGGASPSYQWKLNNNNVGTGSTYTNAALANGDVLYVVLTSNASCVTTSTANSTNTTMVVNSIPITPVAISGNTTVCSGTTATYSVSAVSGATSYTWTLPSGWSGTSTTSSITATANSTAGNVTVTANSSCGSSTAQSVAISINTAPTQPLAITGNTTVCSGTSQSYSITTVNGATSYNWTMPSGWTGSSSSININPVASATSGNITVTAVNSCGSSSSETLAITVNTTPTIPTTILGNITICSGSTNTYNIGSVLGATSYNWTLPSGWTGTSTSTSISATSNTSSGAILVSATNSCGTSSNQSLSVTVNAIPASPASISGNATVCSGSTNTYNVSAVSGATSYTWTLPGGWSGTSTTNSITTTASTTAGNITVTANNGCGSSLAQTLAITVNTTPAQPSSITGNTTVCSGTAENYSITAVSGATSYTWTTPSGWSGTSNTISISAITNTTSGNITVTANNSCGSSSAQSIAVAVNSAPTAPASILGNTFICSGSNNTYQIGSVSGATSYNWTLPSDWSGSSTSTSISTTANANSGTILVTATNACGTSSPQTLTITTNTIPTIPSIINGSSTVCAGTTNTYNVSAVSGASSYTWTLPGSWSGTSTTNSIYATAGTGGGNITVTATNSCGTSAAQTLAITVNSAPAQPGAISGPPTVCLGVLEQFSISAVAGATSYSWSTGLSGNTGSGLIFNVSLSLSDVISVTANNSCGSSAPSTFNVGVNKIPIVSPITGSTTVCPGSTQTYNAYYFPGATYNWTFPSGWSGTSTSSTITVTAGSTGGTITLDGTNFCGTSPISSLAVAVSSTLPAPASISGSNLICVNSTNTYSVTPVSGATSYNWTLPVGWSGTSTTNSISVTADATGGSVSVTASNSCTTSSATTLAISINTIPAQPVAITGNSTVCEASSQSYSIASVNGATSYTWLLPATWTGTSSADNITAIAGNTAGTSSVTADNACGSSASQSFTVAVNLLPTVAVSIYGNTTICSGSTETYYIDAVANATDYTWTLPASWSGTSVTDSITPIQETTGGTISVTANNGCGSSSAQSITVVVNNPPAQPSVITGNATVCQGSANTYSVINDATATSYTWTLPSNWTGTSSTDNITTTADSTSGNITVTANNNCGASASQSFAVSGQALPVVTLAPLGIVCDNITALTLTGGSPAGGIYTGTSVTNSIFNPSAAGAGIYTIDYLYSDGMCSNSASATIQVDLCIGIDTYSETAIVTVAPNPFTEFTTITIDNTVKLNGTELHVYDVLGKEVLVFSNLSSNVIKMERTNLNNGLYYYKLMKGEKLINSGKLLIQ